MVAIRRLSWFAWVLILAILAASPVLSNPSVTLSDIPLLASGLLPGNLQVVAPNSAQLAAHHALVPSDNAFQRTARLRQSLWREKHGYPIDSNGTKPLGSRLAMPFAKDTLANYLTDTIRDVVRAEVVNRSAVSGQLYKEPRIFNDLLSSQPLCFNVFGELQQDLGLASRVVEGLTGEPDATVTAVRFEYSPGRGDSKFTGDHSAFDVFIEYECGNRRRFLGIEVKYVENMAQPPAQFRQRYIEVAQAMGCFHEERLGELRVAPLEQLWRDHLLAGSLVAHPSGRFDGGAFVVLYPEGNHAVAEAVRRYRDCLLDNWTFSVWTLERFLAAVRSNGGSGRHVGESLGGTNRICCATPEPCGNGNHCSYWKTEVRNDPQAQSSTRANRGPYGWHQKQQVRHFAMAKPR